MLVDACVCRCIALFQEQDGVDILLFLMYVDEYGLKCPEPNTRRVVINYLDSVQYLKPRRWVGTMEEVPTLQGLRGYLMNGNAFFPRHHLYGRICNDVFSPAGSM